MKLGELLLKLQQNEKHKNYLKVAVSLMLHFGRELRKKRTKSYL
jgi:hypothetical protein